MKKINRRNIIFIVFFVIIIFIFSNQGIAKSENDKNAIICFGVDMSNNEKNELLKIFKLKKMKEAEIIEITNNEEVKILGDYVDIEKIGEKATSSVYIEKLEKGEGLSVEAYNVNWGTADMYKSAAITAGLEDMKIIVASPNKTSGTSAFAGGIKALEKLSGEKLNKEVKDLTVKEMAVMGELKDSIGEEAVELISKIKREQIIKGYEFSEDLEKMIKEVSKDLNIEANKKDIEKILDFMIMFSRADINKVKIYTNIKTIKSANIPKDIANQVKDLLILPRLSLFNIM